MRRLADLDSTAWTTASTPAGPDGSRPAVSAELRSLLRVLRCDPGFFTAMRHTPEVAVAQVEHRIQGAERDVLLAAVRGEDAGTTALSEHVTREWAAISGEHRRVPRQQTRT